MQQVVDEQHNRQQARLPPHPNQGGGRGQKKWRGEKCNDFFYFKVCPRGDTCKNAHQLVGANQMANRSGSSPNISQSGPQGAGSGQGNRSRPGGRPLPTPAYHPDHPDYAAVMARARTQSESGNGMGQQTGAPAVQANQPLSQFGPQGNQGQGLTGSSTRSQTSSRATVTAASASGPFMRPRAASTASSEATARQTVQQSISQQSSSTSQLDSLAAETWRETLERAMAELKQDSRGPQNRDQDQDPTREQ